MRKVECWARESRKLYSSSRFSVISLYPYISQLPRVESSVFSPAEPELIYPIGFSSRPVIMNASVLGMFSYDRPLVPES